MSSPHRHPRMIPTLVALGLLAACTGSERAQPAADSEVVLVVDELRTATPRPAPSSRTDVTGTTSPLPHPVEEKALRRALAAAFHDGPRPDVHGPLQRPLAGVRHALR